MRKPIYKKWWFWVIIVAAIGAIGIFGGGETPTERADREIAKQSAESANQQKETEPANNNDSKQRAVNNNQPKQAEVVFCNNIKSR